MAGRKAVRKRVVLRIAVWIISIPLVEHSPSAASVQMRIGLPVSCGRQHTSSSGGRLTDLRVSTLSADMRLQVLEQFRT